MKIVSLIFNHHELWNGSKGVLPLRLVIHSRHVAFLDYAMLLGEVGFGERLFGVC